MGQDRVLVFDTTLRDGEQSPGISLQTSEKLEIAHQLARLGVDVIEAGFPITSPGDLEAVQRISREVEGPIIAALARTHSGDIDAAWQGVRDASRPRIHTFISTSDIHIQHQLRTDRQDVLGQAKAAVAHAKSYCQDVEFSPMDATRADLDFTAEVCQAAIREGATTINIPDTVGYTTPDEFAAYLQGLYQRIPELHDVVLSVHCHNDLGLAVANSLAGIMNGARQVECAINGIGERAGNAALEEFAMLLRTRGDACDGLWTGIHTQEIARTSRLVSRLTGYQVQPNKAVVGKNAFAHESGIHQDGVLKERSTYEIMDAQDVGLEDNQIILGKHSGRHALQDALQKLGYDLSGEELRHAFRVFKELADRKKQITAMDLEALMTDSSRAETAELDLEWYQVHTDSREEPYAKVALRLEDGMIVETSSGGDGAFDALFSALGKASGTDVQLRSFSVGAVTGGEDALGEVSVVVEVGGTQGAGQAVSSDVLQAAAWAYLRAISRARSSQGRNQQFGETP